MDTRKNVFTSKFLYVLASLMLYFIALPFLTEGDANDYVITLIFSLVVLVLINITTEKRYLLMASFILGMTSLVTYWGGLYQENVHHCHLVHYLVNVVFLSIITYSVIQTIARQKKVTPDTLFGAVTAYLLIGLTWSYIYLIIECLSPHSFTELLKNPTARQLLEHYIYYSFSTLSTVGYGDIVSTTNVAHTFSWIEAVTGQIYLAVWISQLVGLHIIQRGEKNDQSLR